MRHFEKGRAHFCVVGCSFPLLLCFILGLMGLSLSLRAQAGLTITNLSQLAELTSRGQQVVVNILLDATVFACDTNSDS